MYCAITNLIVVYSTNHWCVLKLPHIPLSLSLIHSWLASYPNKWDTNTHVPYTHCTPWHTHCIYIMTCLYQCTQFYVDLPLSDYEAHSYSA